MNIFRQWLGEWMMRSQAEAEKNRPEPPELTPEMSEGIGDYRSQIAMNVGYNDQDKLLTFLTQTEFSGFGLREFSAVPAIPIILTEESAKRIIRAVCGQ